MNTVCNKCIQVLTVLKKNMFSLHVFTTFMILFHYYHIVADCIYSGV